MNSVKLTEGEIAGLSIVVRDLTNDGNIVAVCLNDVERQQVDADDVTIFNSVDKEQHPNMWKIIHLLEDLVQGIDLFSRYKLDAYVVLQILCVNQTNGGRGLGRKLIHLTEILAKQLGHTLVISEVIYLQPSGKLMDEQLVPFLFGKGHWWSGQHVTIHWPCRGHVTFVILIKTID